ncbi:MAG: hypothetical protein JWO89_3317 [Verrucomicrobiaceae bacterium]|nr:hypothetical protein [Verrucomicrobiaceae bacterium]
MMTELTPPPKVSNTGSRLAKIGALLQLGPLIGMMMTVVGMIRAFHAMSDSGIGDPSALAQPIGEVLITTMLGIAAALVGIVLMLVARFALGYRERWVVPLLMVVGVFWLGVVPALSYVASKRTPVASSSQETNNPVTGTR